MKDNRWRIVVAVAVVTMLAGCVMVGVGEPGAGTALFFTFMILLWFGVLENPHIRS